MKRDPSHAILCLRANTPGSKNMGSVPQKVRRFEPKEGRIAVYFRRTNLSDVCQVIFIKKETSPVLHAPHAYVYQYPHA